MVGAGSAGGSGVAIEVDVSVDTISDVDTLGIGGTGTKPTQVNLVHLVLDVLLECQLVIADEYHLFLAESYLIEYL